MLVVVFCLFLAFQKINIKQSPNGEKLWINFSKPEGTHEGSGEDLRSCEEATSSWGALPRLVGPSQHLLT